MNMKIIGKIASLTLAFCMLSVLLVGCGNSKVDAEIYELIKNGLESVDSRPSGEIMVYETIKAEQEIPEKLRNIVTETYITFINRETLDYDFTERTGYASEDKSEMYEAYSEGGNTTVKRNGESLPVSEAPDIFSYFDLDFELSDIKKAEKLYLQDSVLYTVVLKDSFMKSAPFVAEGVAAECEKIAYNFYFDNDGVLLNFLSEYSFKVTEGDGQTVTHFTQTTINE